MYWLTSWAPSETFANFGGPPTSGCAARLTQPSGLDSCAACAVSSTIFHVAFHTLPMRMWFPKPVGICVFTALATMLAPWRPRSSSRNACHGENHVIPTYDTELATLYS